MEYIKYIDNLSSMKNDFDEGMLSQLIEESPEELHGNIMKSINREKKKRMFLNYKTYVPAVAVVFMFVIFFKVIIDNNHINLITKNKMAAKIETTNLTGLDCNKNKNDDNNQAVLNKESSITSTIATENNGFYYFADKSAQISGYTSEINSKDKVSTLTGDKNISRSEAAFDKIFNKNANISGRLTYMFEQNKKVLKLIKDFKAEAVDNSSTYKVTAYQFDRLKKKIADEGIRNSVLTVLSVDEKNVIFRLNIK